MRPTVAIGYQDFSMLRENHYFYIDKTDFIREWWEGGDQVTLIARPRRFGKTLNMSMTEQFFSVDYRGRFDLFEGLSIWEQEKYRNLQGTYPVISLSFANIKEENYNSVRLKIGQMLTELYSKYSFLNNWEGLSQKEKEYIEKIDPEMDEYVATTSLNQLSNFLSRYYGKKVIILLDEYDTPMQEAYVHGYWEKLVSFIRNLFNSTFKTNPYLGRALMTGITRVSKESIFSDLNNLKVITTTSEKYADIFGFTEEEVFAALDDYDMSEKKEKVKFWYDGFTFGNKSDIYNPWSVINFLDNGRVDAYWANTSSNSLIGKLIREGSTKIKITMEGLLKGEVLSARVDEQIVFNQLDADEDAIWSLFLACGYLRVQKFSFNEEIGRGEYELVLTNFEVKVTFEKMIASWFASGRASYGDFVKALLLGDVEAMNHYMNRVALATFSYFDTGSRDSGISEPERFYHGFVLGLMVGLSDKYVITSNRESGFGRYDIMMEPKKPELDAIILEFKVHNPKKEQTLEDTVAAALSQIEDKGYEADLIHRGIASEKIRKYGFAFQGKEVLIG